METQNLTWALVQIIKVLKKYVYLKNKSSYLVLGLFVLISYCFKIFDAVPYLLITGPLASGKTLILELLNVLCYKALMSSQISQAAFFHAINQLNGTLLIDEAESLANRFQKEFLMPVLRQGYKKAGEVVRVNPGTRKIFKHKCYGLKAIANIGGIYDKALRTRFISIRTTEAENEVKQFSMARDGSFLKELASGLRELFKRKKIQDKIKARFLNFSNVEGVRGRDLEIWTPLFVLALAPNQANKK